MTLSLPQHCGGKVSRLVEICDKDAVRLAHQLAASFPCFRDQATYDGQTVVFLKRAQIFPADLWNRFGGTRYGEFRNIGDLTMFADYRYNTTLLFFHKLNKRHLSLTCFDSELIYLIYSQ